MKRIKFIEKLVIENKLLIVEPSCDICNSYRQKSENSLKAAKLLLGQNLLEEATSMSYYAMFHKTIALLRNVGIKCENHAGAIILLKEIFDISNEDISYAKEERVDKQYYTDFVITKKDAQDLIKKAEQYIEKLDIFIDTMSEEKRQKYRQKFEKQYNIKS
jgi:uncharacterized protein (UPF0332 family)